MTIDIPQLEALIDKLVSAPAAADQQLLTALTKCMLFMREIAIGEAPVKTGNLVNHIKYDVDPASLSAKLYTDAVSEKGAPYPVYVHQGTGIYAIDQSLTTGRLAAMTPPRGIKPNQFFVRTMEMADDYIEESFTDAATSVALYIGALDG